MSQSGQSSMSVASETGLATDYKAPQPFVPTPGRPSIFLAGSVDPSDKGERWQKAMARRLAHLPIDILDPWRDDWDNTWEESKDDPRFAQQIKWEITNQGIVDLVAIHFHPKSAAPISLLELGLSARIPGKVIVCCPDGFWKKGNVELVCEHFNVPMVDRLSLW